MIAVDWQIRMRSNHLVVCGPDDHNIAEFRHVHSSPATPSLCFYCKVVKIGSSTHAVPLCLETTQVPYVNVYSVATLSTRPRALGTMRFTVNELLWDAGVLFVEGSSSIALKCSRVRNGNDPSMRLVALQETIDLIQTACGAREAAAAAPAPPPLLDDWHVALLAHTHKKHAQVSAAYAACVANAER